MTAPVTEQPGTPPNYPPKTPPPPKRPLSPPRPDVHDDTAGPDSADHAADAEGGSGGDGKGPAAGPGPVVRTARRGATMRNRRGVNWTLESAPWAAPTARRRVLAQLHAWGHHIAPAMVTTVEEVTTLLVQAAVADTGRRISVHLSDQDGQVCVLLLSHQADLTPGHAPDGDQVLHQVTAQTGVTGCGTDTGPDGRRLWAVIDL